YASIEFDSKYLTQPEERELIKSIALYPEIVEKAGKDFDPSVICSYLYDLTKLFSKWYHDNKILKAEDKNVVVARMGLSSLVLQTIKNAFPLVGVTFLESM
ncbi:MAG: DALR anticodon-binding domain-containing protein, partial [Sphaerochaetaceae bacterium]|nr:DALR anticodon-binding domain-containing protein [Sphaerochaetaceae bacterium]